MTHCGQCYAEMGGMFQPCQHRKEPTVTVQEITTGGAKVLARLINQRVKLLEWRSQSNKSDGGIYFGDTLNRVDLNPWEMVDCLEVLLARNDTDLLALGYKVIPS